MLFSNYRVGIEPRDTPEGNLNCAVMGEFYAGSRRFYLEAPRKVGKFIKGDRPDLSISDASSRPDLHIWRVIKVARPSIHLLLSSRHHNPRVDNIGSILAPAGQAVELIDHATSSKTARSTWQVALLAATPGDVFAVELQPLPKPTKSTRAATPPNPARYFYLVGNRTVIEVTQNELKDSYAKLLSELERVQLHHTTADLVGGGWQNLTSPRAPVRALF